VLGQTVSVFGEVHSAAYSLITALASHYLFQAHDQARLWLTHPNPRVRDRIAAELDLWNIRPLLLPSLPEPTADGEVTAAPETIAERLAVMNTLSADPSFSKPQVVILSPESLLSPAPSPEALKASAFTLRLGDNINPEDFEKKLIASGYERVMQVHAHGQIARRGGIMDIHSWHSASPLRLEFFDTEIESLREFDIDSQVSIRRVKHAEITLNDTQLDATLRDYLQPNDRLIAAGKITPDAPHGIITDLGDDETGNTTCYGSPLGTFEAGDFILNEARRHRFFQQIADWKQNDYTIFLSFSNKGERERFEELVESNFFSNGTVTPLAGELVQGFTIPDADWHSFLLLNFLADTKRLKPDAVPPAPITKHAHAHKPLSKISTMEISLCMPSMASADLRVSNTMMRGSKKSTSATVMAPSSAFH